ncbi:Z-DNA-binding protein 1 [Spea bombifrons]|uniref:Z-DNA-binding protein 1 n=1 Tax=Spea bombifrons TaxID=233779 RepID=UPI002349283A|nr:Z-DNA-binding protein 1 [Spea bombifrons]
MASGAESGLIHVKVLDTLGTLDREIYQYLQKKSPKKAINVARGVNKTAAKDVNPNLYKMKKLGLLHCEDQTKLWSISNGTASDMPNGKICNTAMADVEESNTQEKILAILSKKNPQRALSIAQELKKSSAKDVNPILYKMKDMKLLDHDSDTKLWSIKSEEDAAPRRTDDPTATESPKKCKLLLPIFGVFGRWLTCNRI